ncbi:MAG: phosphodiester glycosidase family protein [Verrucomicrobia bacterium]|nr:phosphodiester glycosidase family protein [Verrucomicrobiota bacterium]
MHRFIPFLRRLGVLLAVCVGWQVWATPELPAWRPIFKGIEHLTATNSSAGGDFENLSVIHALRIDLADPDVRLLATPPITNHIPSFRETAGHTVSQFLRTNQLQAAINAGFFDPGQYYLPDSTPMTAEGLLISQGEVVSPPSFSYSATLLVSSNNVAQIIPTNWPAASTNGVWTAVSGDYPILVDGVNIGKKFRGLGGIHSIHPRTVIGLSADRKYLFLVAIDGRQPGYSDGTYDGESAAWLLLLGAHDGINMDGGGSTTMVIEDTTGNPLRLNRSSAVADSGKERTVGCHLGVYAPPVPGFINDVVVLPDDDAATVSWTTTQPATSQVEYGPTEELGLVTPEDSKGVSHHGVRLTGLQPNTGYYFRVRSQNAETNQVSPVGYFITENYLETNQVVELTGSWKSSTQNLDGVAWADPKYDDSAWQGPGEGLLWVDTRSSGPIATVGPRGAQLAADSATGFPYVTYYFRRHFESTLAGPGASLLVSGFVDDGAVFYLNGQEVYRLRMDEPGVPILNGTLAVGYPCDGDAVCRDEFVITNLGTHLVPGDNVLAVEVHNYNVRSADMTFGVDVWEARSVSIPALLAISDSTGATTLTWTRGGFVLQWAESAQGPWVDVPGPVLLSPHVVNSVEGGARQFYRLRK